MAFLVPTERVQGEIQQNGHLTLTTGTEFLVESLIVLGPMDMEAGPGPKIIQACDYGGEWRDLPPIEEGEKLIVHPGTRLRLRPDDGEALIDHKLQGKVRDWDGLVVGREVVVR